MALNSGKRFEQNFKNSIPKDVFLYRLKDSSNNWSENIKTRFTPSNMCDYIMFNGYYLFLLELKTTKATSFPFNNIKDHQINDLFINSKYNNVISGIIILFDKYNECYFIEISDFKRYLDASQRKSLPIDFCRKKGIKIENKIMKINRVFDIKKFIEEVMKRMPYISRYDLRFLTLMNRKYNKEFVYFDDYIMWLYYEFVNENEEKYYKTLEKDLWDYVDFQSGKERDLKDRVNVGEKCPKKNKIMK